ncbi:hypothetical protein PGN35_007755 [Nodosilinea sp. PGN35]|uniref:hypothetical protein n=1 Tax=Nodosilinea sp. PGN35 TaxID=3020489 RepID=UPI0023B2AF37|nr:hypothetical protein [Nodosilinea sp. TSF1-S3]MDF0367168.1 hypothetical protein [Nodosilinea sp. TSF1-S3]
MFDYLEPDASDEQGNSGAGGNTRGTRSLKPPTPEKVRHLLYGSLAGLERTIKILHVYGYADPNDWSDPIPVPQPSRFYPAQRPEPSCGWPFSPKPC